MKLMEGKGVKINEQHTRLGQACKVMKRMQRNGVNMNKLLRDLLSQFLWPSPT